MHGRHNFISELIWCVIQALLSETSNVFKHMYIHVLFQTLGNIDKR